MTSEAEAERLQMSLDFAHLEKHKHYFFYQRRCRPLQRRVRKTFDDYSLFGERRETLLTFKGAGDVESVTGGGLGRRSFSAAKPLRPGTASKRLSENVPIVLPPIDPTGPNFVSGPDSLEAVETKSTRSEKKTDLLKPVVEEPEQEKSTVFKPRKQQPFQISEAKFTSSSILSNLSKFLYNISEDFSVSLPVDLVYSLLQNFHQLVADTLVEKREWQTDCYLDFEPKNPRPFLTCAPVKESEKATLDVERILQDKVSKQVKMSQEAVSHHTTKRPLTARSILSSYSYKSDISRASSAVEYQFDYDLLPAELQPSILHYKRESRAPQISMKGPKTRLEKVQERKPRPKKSELVL